MPSSPFVSVVTSVYNGERYLQECVDSILNQTHQNFEFIILDNGSTDGSRTILDRISDPRVVVVHQENLGIAGSLNKGVRMAKGELIFRLDADDCAAPDRLEKQILFMEANPDYVLCGGAYEEWREGHLTAQREEFLETDATIRRNFSRLNPFAHSSVVFRRQAFVKVGGYNPSYQTCQDYDLWIRLMQEGKACNLKDNLGFIRFYETSTMLRNKRKLYLETLDVKWRAYMKFGGSLGRLLYFSLRGGVLFTLPNVISKHLYRRSGG
ncbi:MAG: glycosyltransferase [Candidatus Nitrohelix vancouverensis]|uniref:Glycosyltransferase n=1 Tax=Candidatus Nitrohelix vancouverensis TaxID=2705534 RepID=A0A7T0C049_9BACT|nr:MAG: glycosyltransferase [Candidatus Nitrohelix vancouverensis]